MDLGLAARISREAHEGQFRRDGVTPYFEHCEDVADYVMEMNMSMDCVAAALLHDVLEDTKETAQTLLDKGVSEEVVKMVQILTHGKGVPYNNYIRKVHYFKNTAWIKMADIICNLCDSPTEKQVKKYKEALFRLTTAIRGMG